MPLTLNENVLKITGKASLEREVELNKRYAVGLLMDVTDDNNHNNEDGTFDRIFTGKLVRAEIKGERGETIRTKDTTKQSVKLRLSILRAKANPDMEDNAWYEMIMGGIRHRLPEIIDQIIKEQ
jgi:hypothetical protein